MDYDFTTVIDRTPFDSVKWQIMREANPTVEPGVPPFSVADLDLANAPEITEGLREYLLDAVLGYTRPTDAYFDAVIGWMRRRHHWDVERDWLVQAPGVVPAFFTGIRAFSEPGDGVIIQTPAYYPFYMAIERNHRTLVRNPLCIVDGIYRLDLEALEEAASHPQNKILLFCSPHNPTGRVWGIDELRAVADIAIRHDLVVISDEIHFDLVLAPNTHTVMSQVSSEIAGRTVVCTAPSKTFNLAGMSTSNIVIESEDMRERFRSEQEAQGFFSLNILGYKACELAYTRAEGWLDGLLDLVQTNKRLVADVLGRQLPEVSLFDLQGTYLQWMDFRAFGLSAEKLEARNQQQAQVFFDEGHMFGDDGRGFERMNLATPTAAVRAALERLVGVYKG